MGIGGCIGMIALGAVLTFAVDLHVKGVNVDLIGIIMMAVGVIGLASYVSILKRHQVQPPKPGAPVVDVEEHRF
jgi:hypothetical protein